MVEEHATWSYIAEMFLWTTWWGWIGWGPYHWQSCSGPGSLGWSSTWTGSDLLHSFIHQAFGKGVSKRIFSVSYMLVFFNEKTAKMYTNLLFWLLKICFFWRLPFYVMMMKSLNIMKMIEQLMLSWDERW